ncbi:hypothetical protein ASPZODRAFT_149986 [Penicilliopsis zonata CBS 506.65]|uniref:Aminoglycoside phosphotransferase domain-containing protein n=1 Tax=Penicilliopsis zonata CBS 506.65 TaxID=1073090 RepID=A0A1L9SPI1_9EURO|nr:hypothetical protein ASPZODRAFT_149986 [Penicilliopsis zonata CBS 506.65]OJJ49026.1 hypothetical protein ASPZODRAFT_149986 [Penicilliopsis zonata CBS 506.65]
MDDPVISLSNADAPHWNRDLMLEFQAALAEDPAADLLSMFTDSYLHAHRKDQNLKASHAETINFRMLTHLYDAVKKNPKVNLLSVFPLGYHDDIEIAAERKNPDPEKGRRLENRRNSKGKLMFRERFDDVEGGAQVVFPLSEDVIALLSQYSSEGPDEMLGDQEKLLSSLKQLLRKSPRIWDNFFTGMVVKCNERIVAKVGIQNDEDNPEYTEYTSMQYLEQQVPDIPASRPRGLVEFYPYWVIFMSYVPDMSLADAWPSLRHKDKLSIQHQLEAMFDRLRSIRQDDGQPLGGVCGEGVKEVLVKPFGTIRDITTSKQYLDLHFSTHRRCSKTYMAFLRSLLEQDGKLSASMQGSVFSHGDVRTANIMVQRDASTGQWVVSGIIDWAYAGFYPEYYEGTGVARALSFDKEDDWYLYLPRNISPANFPVPFLVNRLLHHHDW